MVAALEFAQVIAIAAGYAHTVVLTDDGDIYTWGNGRMGRLGHGTDSDEVLPRKLVIYSHVSVHPVAVAAGEAHTCVLRSDGSLVTIGRLTHGRGAEGVSIESVQEEVNAALRMQSYEDWAHFPS
jgi:alpha-tubulin suppressor-like RCC1 family protein